MKSQLFGGKLTLAVLIAFVVFPSRQCIRFLVGSTVCVAFMPITSSVVIKYTVSDVTAVFVNNQHGIQ